MSIGWTYTTPGQGYNFFPIATGSVDAGNTAVNPSGTQTLLTSQAGPWAGGIVTRSSTANSFFWGPSESFIIGEKFMAQPADMVLVSWRKMPSLSGDSMGWVGATLQASVVAAGSVVVHVQPTYSINSGSYACMTAGVAGDCNYQFQFFIVR
jgi:hypothetical protein